MRRRSRSTHQQNWGGLEVQVWMWAFFSFLVSGISTVLEGFVRGVLLRSRRVYCKQIDFEGEDDGTPKRTQGAAVLV